MNDRAAKFKGLFAAGSQWAARTLFPPVCGGCRRLVQSPGSLCAACWPKLRFIERPFCEILGTPFLHDMGEGILSADALANPPPFARARAAVAYSGGARQMVQSFKFGDRTEMAPWMARWMLRAGGDLIREADVVVPVPLHRRRFFLRRFNQSAELARAISHLSGKPFEPDAVLRVRFTRSQVGLGARERADNVRGAFRVPEARRSLLRGRRVLLVDDVYTTGMTVSAVTKVILAAGAHGVDVRTFARVLPGDFRSDDPETI